MYQYETGGKTAGQARGVKSAVPARPVRNNTGIPEGMKRRFESLSGFSFDDVKVHYNSPKPAQLQALAYTQGNSVYIAGGQERHLEHELGHVVQQKAGIVRAMAQLGGMPVNTSPALETQADILAHKSRTAPVQSVLVSRPVIQCCRVAQFRVVEDVRLSPTLGPQFAARHLITEAQARGNIGGCFRSRNDAVRNTVILMTEAEFISHIGANRFTVNTSRTERGGCEFEVSMTLRAFVFGNTAPERNDEGGYVRDVYRMQVSQWDNEKTVGMSGQCSSMQGSNCVIDHIFSTRSS